MVGFFLLLLNNEMVVVFLVLVVLCCCRCKIIAFSILHQTTPLIHPFIHPHTTILRMSNIWQSILNGKIPRIPNWKLVSWFSVLCIPHGIHFNGITSIMNKNWIVLLSQQNKSTSRSKWGKNLHTGNCFWTN